MERHTKQTADIPKWSALLVEAVNKPGLIMKAYSNFHSYSIGNLLLALVQCYMRGLQPGPINTFPKWKALGRYVKRGERALTLCMPITRKRRSDESDNDESDGEGTFTSFLHKERWFVLSQTEGNELEPQVMPEWEAKRALAALDIELIAFDSTTGNCQGFARRGSGVNLCWRLKIKFWSVLRSSRGLPPLECEAPSGKKEGVEILEGQDKKRPDHYNLAQRQGRRSKGETKLL